MKINFNQSIALTSLSLLLSFIPVLAQSSYRVTIKNANGVQVGQAFNTSSNINTLVGNIYPKIKPSGSPLPRVVIQLGSTNLKSFQNNVKSKGVSADYYEFPSGNLTNKDYGNKINSSSIRSTTKNYGVILRKPGYAESQIMSFKVTQISNNIPALRFSDSKVALEDKKRISFILETGNSGLNSNQIAKALNSKDYRLSKSGYSNFQAYQNCLESLRRNPVAQDVCDDVNFVVSISR